ncbi:MAG: hypothetical protein ACLQQ0_13370 [Limisphaerales bacterium]
MNHTKIERRSAYNARFWSIMFLLGITSTFCEAHDQSVHEKIAESAANSSAGLPQFLNDTGVGNTPLIFEPAQFGPHGLPPIEWIKQGAIREDDSPRYADHFYTVIPARAPGQVKGLTDWHESLVLPGHVTNSYAWGAIPGVLSPFLLGNPPTPTNTESWECARNYEYAALTSTNQTARDANLAHMFYALGHILHLNQDLSQPGHVRNDEHLHPWHRWIENYGSKTYQYEPNAFPLEPHGWTYWRSQGFSSVLDFWDRGHFMGNASALDADAAGSDKLGLAEFSNGNFLSEDATYAEFFSSSSIHYFPFPSLADTTQPQIDPNNLPATAIRPVMLENGKQGDVVYLSKTNAGIIVTSHSALHYFAVLHPPRVNSPGMQVALTINDPNVLQEYHEILIPKAVEYSAGLLDYFFRGTMKVGLNLDTNAGPCAVTNINTSGQDFYGGMFYLFAETNGVRFLIQSNDWSGNTLPNGATMTMAFPGPPPDGARFYSVYQGTIGVTNGSALDPVDEGIGIAVGHPWVEQTKTYTYWEWLSDLGLANGSTISSNLVSDDFLFTPAPGGCEVIINGGFLDDSGTIGFDDSGSGGIYFPFTGTCGDLAPINANTIVPASGVYIEGNHLRVNIRATDAIDCGWLIGWVDISITWRAWPAP